MLKYQSITHIKDNIYLGDCQAANSRQLIKQYKIDIIVTVAAYINIQKNVALQFTFPIHDTQTEQLRPYFEQIFPLLEQHKESNILIHCRHGVSRSASIVIGYLISQGMTYQEAHAFVKNLRPCINPNKNFEAQLKQL